MRILCLGNNSEDTDVQTRALAKQANMPCHGLLSEFDCSFDQLDYNQPGYYHTSVVDIQLGNLKELISQFDKIIMLDQPIEQWNHPNEFYNTVTLVPLTSTKVKFLNPQSVEPAKIFTELTQNNKSFCIFPFIQLHTTYDYTQLCCRSNKSVTNLDDLKDFSTDPAYQRIRESMLQGKMLPEYCQICYTKEQHGVASDRQVGTIEWVHRLGIKNLSDLKNIKKPAFYDLRPSNKCNLMCRSCNPEDSHLIEREYQELNLTVGRSNSTEIEKHQQDRFELIEFDNLNKLLVAGGEPTIMAEFFTFLEKCIVLNHTEFEINVVTNGTQLSDRLKNLVKQFQNFSWTFSIDGYQNINYYIRYPSTWNNIIENWQYHRNQKNPVTVNTTISIYNIDSLDLLFCWMDKEFPNTFISCNTVVYPRYLNPLLFPDRDSVLSSLDRVMLTNCYKNNNILATTVDSLYQQFEKRVDVDQSLLEEFYKFNDLLDHSRNIQLKNYIPTLDRYREKYVF
jgi:hypothetical protein